MSFHVPNKYRLGPGRGMPSHMLALASTPADGNNGCFTVPNGKLLFIIQASDGLGWEHVSVSLQRKSTNLTLHRCPTWEQMCQMKALFWDAEDIVLQFHPAESDYRNVHEFCLHLWRPIDVMFPCPPSEMIA